MWWLFPSLFILSSFSALARHYDCGISSYFFKTLTLSLTSLEICMIRKFSITIHFTYMYTLLYAAMNMSEQCISWDYSSALSLSTFVLTDQFKLCTLHNYMICNTQKDLYAICSQWRCWSHCTFWSGPSLCTNRSTKQTQDYSCSSWSESTIHIWCKDLFVIMGIIYSTY